VSLWLLIRTMFHPNDAASNEMRYVRWKRSWLISRNYALFKVDSHYAVRHDTTRHDKIFLYGFDMLEFTLAGHRKVKIKTDKDCHLKKIFCLIAGRCECRLAFVASYNVNRLTAWRYRQNHEHVKNADSPAQSDTRYFRSTTHRTLVLH
jgi:hypothetical protein